jgi:hypothetical protein
VVPDVPEDAVSTPNPRLLGSTDAAAILGLSRYRSAWDVQRRILDGWRGPVTPPMLRGLAVEPLLARRVADLLGLHLRPLAPVERPHGRDWQRVSFDYDEESVGSFDAGGAIVELKTANEYAYRADWAGEPDGVPLDYQVQVQVQLEATGRPYAWVPCLVVPGDLAAVEAQLADLPEPEMRAAVVGLAPLVAARGELRVYRLERDADMGAAIVAACAAWWRRHIVGGEPCVPTATRDARDYLRARHPVEREPVRPADTDEEALIAAYLEAREAREVAAQRAEDLGVQLAEAIGDAGGVDAGEARALYRATAPRRDTAAALEEALGLLGAAGIDTRALLARHTTAGSRRLDVRRRAARRTAA